MSQAKKKIRQLFRDAVFARDSFKCNFCNEKEKLDAHHITDRTLMPNGGYVIENGITVCEKHHLICEQFHITGKPVLGFSPDDLYKKIGSSLDKARVASERLKI